MELHGGSDQNGRWSSPLSLSSRPILAMDVWPVYMVCTSGSVPFRCNTDKGVTRGC